MSTLDESQAKEAENTSPFQEVGGTGYSPWGPVVAYIETDASLRGAQGARTYEDMRRTDHTCSAMYAALTAPIRGVLWRAEPASESEADKKAADHLWQAINTIPELSFQDLIADICTMFSHGWSWHEMVMERRDGVVGFANIGARPQTTLLEWKWDEIGKLFGMWQFTGLGDNALIPESRSLHFVTDRANNDPEGLSMYRAAVRPRKYRMRLEQVEGTGFFRQHAGFPVVKLPPQATTIAQKGAGSDEAKASQLVRSIYQDRMMGAVIPNTWDLTFGGPTGSTSSTGLGEAITRKDAEMALSVLAQWLLLGLTATGTQSLAGTLQDFFMTATEAFLEIIAGAFNRRLVPYLFDWYVDPAMSALPTLKYSSPRIIDLTGIAAFVQALGKVGALTMDSRTEDFFRQLVPGMPLSGAGAGTGVPKKNGDEEGDDDEQSKEDDDEEQMRRGGAATFAAKPAPADRLGAYQALADSNAAAQRENLERFTLAMADDVSTLDADMTHASMQAALDDWVMVGLLMFRERSVLDIGAAFWLGFGAPTGPASAQQVLNGEIALADSWLGYSPSGELASDNPAGKPTLFGDIAGKLEGRIAAILLLLKQGRTEEVALEISTAVRQATQGFSRGGKYSGHVWHASWVGAHEGADNPLEAVRWTLDVLAQHCIDCPQYGSPPPGRIYSSWDAMLVATGGVAPGHGTQCDGQCRCGLAALRGGIWVTM
jgi:hypothetical protein